MSEAFLEAQRKERFFFKDYCKKLSKYLPKDGYTTHISDENSYSFYDVHVTKSNPNDSHIIGGIYIEIKVRETTNLDIQRNRDEGWILEDKKLKNLQSIANLTESDIYYINFTSHFTLVWNLSDLIRKGLLQSTQNKVMNKATMASRSNKISKKIHLLKEEWARKEDYIINLKDYYNYYNDQRKLHQKRVRNANFERKCIFDALKNKNK